jgi:hypothetical protein
VAARRGQGEEAGNGAAGSEPSGGSRVEEHRQGHCDLHDDRNRLLLRHGRRRSCEETAELAYEERLELEHR